MKVGAVVVAYQPCIEELEFNLHALRHQVDWIVLVNNGEAQLCKEFSLTKLVDEEVYFGSNRGLAVAQNLGISKLQDLGAEAVLLLDQDSQLYDGAVKVLAEVLQEDTNLAAVGPVYRERLTDSINTFYHVRWFRQKRMRGESLLPKQVKNVDFLISSGSLINMINLPEIGLMREDFFVDFIDTDWCIRARTKGYALGGVGGEMMLHSLGDQVVRVWLGKWRELRLYEPKRYYYFFKNGAHLLLDSNVPRIWKSVIFLNLVGTFFVVLLAARKQRFLSVSRAISGMLTAIR